MSRHTLAPLLTTQTVVVGWDRPMGTYFAHVHDLTINEDEADPIIAWFGGDFREITTAAALIEAVRPYAVVPDTLEAVLDAEAAEDFIDPGPYSNTVRDWTGA